LILLLSLSFTAFQTILEKEKVALAPGLPLSVFGFLVFLPLAAV
jgi:hypothetical protein